MKTSKRTRNPNPALNLYRTVAADIRRCLMLGDIAADHHNPRRAAYHLIGALDELAPELRALTRVRRA